MQLLSHLALGEYDPSSSRNVEGLISYCRLAAPDRSTNFLCIYLCTYKAARLPCKCRSSSFTLSHISLCEVLTVSQFVVQVIQCFHASVQRRPPEANRMGLHNLAGMNSGNLSQSTAGSLIFELAEGGPQSSYQTLDLSSPAHPNVEDKPKRNWRQFWWLKGGIGRPRRFDKLNALHRKFEWRSDFYKPLSVLFYPQVMSSTPPQFPSSTARNGT